MPVQTQYNFTQQVDYPPALAAAIQASTIVTAMVNIETSGSGPSMAVTIWFKDALSTADAATLASLMASYGNPQAPATPASPPKVVQVLGIDTLTLTPFGAFSGSQIAAGGTTNWDIPLPMNMTLKGAKLFSPNAALGDCIAVSLIDKDNVTGQGGTPESPTLLGTYVYTWYVVPGLWDEIEDVSVTETIPKGAYLRVAYTSVGSTPPQAVINFLSYVGSP